MVNISLRVLARPVAENLPTMYQKLGTDYDERVLPSICNEVSNINSDIATPNPSSTRSQILPSQTTCHFKIGFLHPLFINRVWILKKPIISVTGFSKYPSFKRNFFLALENACVLWAESC